MAWRRIGRFVKRILRLPDPTLRDKGVMRELRGRLERWPEAEAVFEDLDRGRRWNRWMLDPTASLVALEQLEPRDRPLVIEEYGSGFSTAFLARTLEARGVDFELHGHEHVARFHAETLSHLNHTSVHVHLRALKQLSDDERAALFEAEDPLRFFNSAGRPLPRERELETRVPNCFYDIVPDEVRARHPDLVVLDGPNGSGRALVFPLLRDRLKPGAVVVIDDATHYPFEAELRRCFDIEVVQHNASELNPWTVCVVRGTAPAG